MEKLLITFSILVLIATSYQIEPKINEELKIEKRIHTNIENYVVTDEDIELNKRIKMRITAYAPHDNVSGICAENDSNPKTSLGYQPGVKYVAVDPCLIPYGTIMYIPGYGRVIAGDTGGAVREYDGYAVDVYMTTYDEAITWGVKYLEVIVYE